MTQQEVTYQILTALAVRGFSNGEMEEINKLLSQFGAEQIRIDREYLAEVVQRSRVVVASIPITGRRTIVGIACLVPIVAITGRSGWISHIVVDEGLRRGGIGTGMRECLVVEARRLSLRRLDLTSQESRTAAQGFWQKGGFVRRDTNNFRLELV